MPREEWVKTLPQTIIASCVVLLDDEGRVLLLRYGPGQPGSGSWWLPGGMLDHGEDPLAAARREMFEETGIVLESPPGFLGTDHRLDVGGAGPAIDFFFAAGTITAGARVRLSTEHDRYAWTRPEDIGAMPLTARPETLTALHHAALTGDSVYLCEGKAV